MPVVASVVDSVLNAFINAPNFAKAPIWSSGGALYIGCVFFPGGTRSFGIYKSTDDGATWAIQDSANSPAQGTASVFFDDVSTIVVVNRTAPAFPAAIGIFEFDCTTDTWSTIAVAGPMAQDTFGIWKRPDLTYVVVYDTGAATNNLFSVIYNGAWVSNQNIGVAAGAVAIDGMSSGVMDSTGRVHVFFPASGFVTFWYQALEITNVLGSSFNLSGTLQSGGTSGYTPIGQVVVVGANLVLACNVGGVSVNLYVGGPLAAPVWALSNPIDSTAPPVLPPGIVYDSTNGVMAVISIFDDGGIPNGLIRMLQSTNVADPADDTSWTGADVYALSTDTNPTNLDQTIGMTEIVFGFGSGIIGANYILSVPPFSFLSFYVGAFPFTIPPPPVSTDFNQRIDARGLQPYPLPRMMWADNTGASVCCFPLKKKGC